MTILFDFILRMARRNTDTICTRVAN